MEMANDSGNFSRRDAIKMGLGLIYSPLLMDSITSEQLEKRIIPSSGEKIPAVGLGTWRVFDAGNSQSRRAPLLDVLRTLDVKGASVIDSSPMYGSSETVVGDLSQQLNIRSKIFLATKVWTSGKEDGIEQMNRSFQKMKATKMDLMQVHNLVDVHTHLKTLHKWKEEGKIRYIGITHYLPSAYPEMIRLIKSEKLDFIQCCYNIETRDAEKELLPLSKDKGVAVLINRPFQEGALFGRIGGRPIPEWSKEYGINNWAQFFLKFILAHPGVTCVIPGTSQSVHLEENLNAAIGKLPDERTRQKMAEYFTD
jgi:diketogulonate reductase-like aldo/keto reductase